MVRLVVGTACRWQSRKEEGEENLQEREKEREREREGPAVSALPLVKSSGYR